LPLKPLYAAPLRGLGYLFGPFPTLFCLLAPLIFVFGVVVGESIPFWFFYITCIPFSYLIKKKQKKNYDFIFIF
jgi:uncharacterized membrane protein